MYHHHHHHHHHHLLNHHRHHHSWIQKKNPPWCLSTLVFSVTEKSIESTSSLRELIDAKESKRSSPLAPFINAYLINAAFKPLEVISLLSDDVR